MVRACVLMMAVLGAGIAAQDAAGPVEREVVPAEENAALKYWAAWALNDVGSYSSLDEWLTEGVPADYAGAWDIEELLNATKLEYCDFGVSNEIGAVLAHFGMMRNLQSLLLVESAVMLRDDESAEAAELVAAALRLTQHWTQDDIPVSSLVAAREARQINGFIAEHQESWPIDERAAIAEALNRFDTESPLRMAQALRWEANAQHTYLIGELDGGALEPSKIRKAIDDEETEGIRAGDAVGFSSADAYAQSLVAPIIEHAETDEQAKAMIRYSIDMERRAMLRLAEIWDDPNSAELTSQLQTELQKMAYSGIAAQRVPSFIMRHEPYRETVAMLDQLRAWANGETETLELPEEDEE